MRSDGTAKELEARRRLGVRRVEDGWTQREVAAFLGVAPGGRTPVIAGDGGHRQ